MVLPTPSENEGESEFISRCMADEEMKKEFPDKEQRTAVCFSQFRENKSTNPMKNFQFKSSISKTWEDDVVVTKGVDGAADTITKQRFVQTIVSGIREDRDNERMSQKAVDGMIRQFKSGTIPFFPDHGYDSKTGAHFVYSWKQMMGVWVDGEQDGPHLKATVRLNMKHPDQQMFWDFVHEAKMPIGFSIGGRVKGPKEVIVDDGKED